LRAPEGPRLLPWAKASGFTEPRDARRASPATTRTLAGTRCANSGARDARSRISARMARLRLGGLDEGGTPRSGCYKKSSGNGA